MPTLLCLGLGYCARFYVAEFGARFERMIGTSRAPKPAGRVEMLAFDAAAPSDETDDTDAKPDQERPAKPRSESPEADEAAAQALRRLRRYRQG